MQRFFVVVTVMFENQHQNDNITDAYLSRKRIVAETDIKRSMCQVAIFLFTRTGWNGRVEIATLLGIRILVCPRDMGTDLSVSLLARF